MGIYTDIQWCDSTVNGEIGCDGCELFLPKGNPDKWTCYARSWVEQHRGLNGYPVSFTTPTIFDGRFQKACKWADLTGTKREGVEYKRQAKPWMDNLPRHIFPNDLGDTWTESLAIDWLLPYVDMMEASPHVWLWLTKRPERALQFFIQLGHVPANFYIGTSVTGLEQTGRIFRLLEFKKHFPDALLFLSLEPLMANIRLRWLKQNANSTVNVLQAGIGWVIPGGESGGNSRLSKVGYIRDVAEDCQTESVPCFIKQLGHRTDYLVPGELRAAVCAIPIECEHGFDVCPTCDAQPGPLMLDKKKGGDWREWTPDLHVRQMPRTDFVLKKVGAANLSSRTLFAT